MTTVTETDVTTMTVTSEAAGDRITLTVDVRMKPEFKHAVAALEDFAGCGLPGILNNRSVLIKAFADGAAAKPPGG